MPILVPSTPRLLSKSEISRQSPQTIVYAAARCARTASVYNRAHDPHRRRRFDLRPDRWSFPHCSYQMPLALTPPRLRGIVSFGCLSEDTGRQGTGTRGDACEIVNVRCARSHTAPPGSRSPGDKGAMPPGIVPGVLMAMEEGVHAVRPVRRSSSAIGAMS